MNVMMMLRGLGEWFNRKMKWRGFMIQLRFQVYSLFLRVVVGKKCE